MYSFLAALPMWILIVLLCLSGCVLFGLLLTLFNVVEEARLRFANPQHALNRRLRKPMRAPRLKRRLSTSAKSRKELAEFAIRLAACDVSEQLDYPSLVNLSSYVSCLVNSHDWSTVKGRGFRQEIDTLAHDSEFVEFLADPELPLVLQRVFDRINQAKWHDSSMSRLSFSTPDRVRLRVDLKALV